MLPPPLLQRWGTLLSADGRGVTALAATLVPAAGNGGGCGCRLVVAAGKSVGTLGVWRSGELAGGAPHTSQAPLAAAAAAMAAARSPAATAAEAAAEAAEALVGGAAAATLPGLHATHSLTGVAWLPLAAAAGGAPVLLSCSRDGAFKAWTLGGGSGSGSGSGSGGGGDAVRLVPAPPPQPCR